MTAGLWNAYDTPSAAQRWGGGGLSAVETQTLAIIPDGSSVLDLGGGAGRIAQALEPRGCRIVEADLAAVMAQGAKEKGLPSLQASADALPFKDQAFDAVVMLRLLHLLPKPARAKALTEALRVLKPGGYLAATVLCPPLVPPLGGAYAPLIVRRILRAGAFAAVLASNKLTDAARSLGLGLAPRDMKNLDGERAFFHHFTPGELSDELLMTGWGALKITIDPSLPRGWRRRLPFPGLEARTLAVVARR